ncbi:MAG: STAS domain-containing protein [Gammaproteobacteria bacterium]|nr:STAS domain-containing protein [Gammaproteobacteria bacterium]
MSGENFITSSDGVYEISGLLTFATVPQLLGQSKQWLVKGEQAVTIDLKSVSKADSAGLALMVEWLHLARQAHRELRFINIPSQLTHLIRLSGLQDVFSAASA